MQLNGRRVWLIGASSGIGAAMVPLLAEAGAQLALTARDEQALRAVAARVEQRTQVRVYPGDVTEPDSLRRINEDIRASWGPVDVLIYSAGAWTPVDVRSFDASDFERQVAVNYIGLVRAVAAVLPSMLERRSGDIVGIASLSAYGALPRAEAYGSTKAAVNYLLQSLRFDLKREGIGVTTVNPGFVRTGLTEGNDFPMPFMMEPDDAARVIVRGLLDNREEIHFPRRLSIPLKLFTALPRPLYEWLVFRTIKRA